MGRKLFQAKRCDTEHYGRFFHSMLSKGIYLPPSQFEAFFVSLAHTEARTINRTVEAAKGAIMRTAILAILLLSALQAEAGWRKPGYRTRSREQDSRSRAPRSSGNDPLSTGAEAQSFLREFIRAARLLSRPMGACSSPVGIAPTNSSPEVRLSPAGRRLAALAPINGSYLLISTGHR